MDKVIDSFTSDHPELVNCEVKGLLPGWLKGTLYRNGIGKFRFGPDEAVHLFDGMAVLHQYNIKDGQVSYRNRLLDSDTYRRNKAANRIVVSEFGVVAHPDPCKSLFTRYFSYFFGFGKQTDNDCVNVMLLGDQLYALTETPRMNQIDPVTLDRVNKENLSKYVAVHLSTAHPLVEPDGTTYNIGTHASRHSSYKIIKIPPPQAGDNNPVRSAVLVGSIPCQWPLTPCYSHSFGMTPNYIIFVEQPMACNLFELATGHWTRKSLLDSLHYYDSYKTKLHVLDKSTGSLVDIQFVAKAFCVFHHINAYEEDDQIVVDAAVYEDASIFKCFTLKNIRDNGPISQSRFKRFVLPLNAHEHNTNLVTLPYTTATATALDDGTVYCVPECISDAYIELPRIHYEKYNGQKYRYVYGICTENIQFDKLVKLDILTKTKTLWGEDGYFAGEPVFVPDPEGTEEDDGIILSPMIRTKDDLQSFLLVLDAKTFTEIARAEVPADINIPMSFHGIFANI